MQFLKEIRAHLQNFETDVSDEMHRFIDYLHTKYPEPTDPVPAPIVENTVEQIDTPAVSIPIVETENVTSEPEVVSADTTSTSVASVENTQDVIVEEKETEVDETSKDNK
jgi:hypothetical protein